MRIVSNNKAMDLSIIGYQFSDHNTSGNGYDHDANWLVCEIKYSQDNTDEVYKDPCLLTRELQELTEAMRKIINCEQDTYISEFLEPYLKISIARCEEKITFTIKFVTDTTVENWNSRFVCSILNKEEALLILSELTKFQKIFPER